MTATYLINRDDPIVAAFLGDRAALRELLNVVCRGYGPACDRRAVRRDGPQDENPPEPPS